MEKPSENAVETLNPKGIGPVVLLCEHASNHIPDRYDGLGLTPEDQISHAAWDPGARDVCLHLSQALDAPIVASCVSRLVYDCNRPPESPGAMTERSERIDVPGNQNLTEAQRAERVETVYTPFCAAVDAVLKDRHANRLPTALVTIHSFTPHFFGQPRAVELGILHDEDSRMADVMLAQHLPDRVVRRNDPYGPQDGVTHSLVLHGLQRGLPNVMIELRNDLIASPAGVAQLSEDVLHLLTPAIKAVLAEGRQDA